MKRQPVFITLVILTFWTIIIYLSCAFIKVSLNFIDWGEPVRLAFVILTIFFLSTFPIVLREVKEYLK